LQPIIVRAIAESSSSFRQKRKGNLEYIMNPARSPQPGEDQMKRLTNIVAILALVSVSAASLVYVWTALSRHELEHRAQSVCEKLTKENSTSNPEEDWMGTRQCIHQALGQPNFDTSEISSAISSLETTIGSK
jgi:hypothetical protein